jgi:E1A/CREB-binding protein
MQRIKRNASYYTDRTKQNHWCSSCFEQLKPEEPIILDDGNEVRKCDLQEFKNDALPEEGWVNCDVCHSWVHQICALFNGRTNKSDVRFTCPNCCLKKLESDQKNPNHKLVEESEDLPRCKMSDAIEMGVASALETAYLERAEELGISVDEVEKAEKLTIRVLSNVEKKHFVKDKVCF